MNGHFTKEKNRLGATNVSVATQKSKTENKEN